MRASDADIDSTSVCDLLLGQNSAASLIAMHRPYLTIAQIGTGNHSVGVDWVTGWYERNLINFVHLARLVTGVDDHLLVIYGLGHLPLLTQFARDSGLFEIASINDYLE